MNKIIQIINTLFVVLILIISFLGSALILFFMESDDINRLFFPERLSIIVIFILSLVYFILLIKSFKKTLNYSNDNSRTLYKLAFFSNIFFILSIPLYSISFFYAPLVALFFLISFSLFLVGYNLSMGKNINNVLSIIKIIFIIFIFLFAKSYAQDLKIIRNSFQMQQKNTCQPKSCSDFKTEYNCWAVSRELLCYWKDNKCIKNEYAESSAVVSLEMIDRCFKLSGSKKDCKNDELCKYKSPLSCRACIDL